jgi:putative transposase
MPNGQQQRDMGRFAGACRFVYNQALALQRQRHEQGHKKLGYAELCRLLTVWRHSPETAWLLDAPTHPLQQSLKDLERAYANFFAGRARAPRFKKKGRHDAFRYPDPRQLRLDQAGSRVFLPKLGWLRYRNSRTVPGTVRNVTVSRCAGRWFVSIQTEREVEQPCATGDAVGIDMGVVRFATLSDGTFFVPCSSFSRHETALRKAQQSLSHKVRHGRNWLKALARVHKLHAAIANVRRDFLHQATTAISKNHAMVAVEDLAVKNMSASARGSVEAPGRHVKAKSALNKAILDQGWSEFRRQLDYKLAWRGARLVAVPPRNTSRSCPGCGHVSADNRPSQARFSCVACRYENHADLVGAINILRAGHARCACEVNTGRCQQQEPTEAAAIRLDAVLQAQ